ncbi:DUF2171 domain-containing protein [Paracoccus gahaiensis]|uniref:DUF2171 domain-containing protein n=1 Tax=Paracoccus gahaiensis TaxID=1706839 RepID=A0A4U0RF06_9RHOB|nr:PRC-barrel domain-containing protein [Paracoccus gahaiensis]TJZ94053.1 DUF2171 domain-containing protein [Paracoccus gahaiensis]
MKTSVIAIAAVMSLGTAAMAQDTPAPTAVPEPNLDMTVAPGAAETGAMADMSELDDSVMITGWDMSVDDVEDMDVHDADGNQIGEVEEVLGRDETAEAIVVDFDDDQGYEGEDRIVPLDMLSVADDALELSADADVASFEEHDD